jgi:hypothetical protein
MTKDASVETNIDEYVDEDVDYEYDIRCDGCMILKNGNYCSYLNHNVCYACPCLECIIKVVCMDGCKQFDKSFFETIPNEKGSYENKTL